MQTSAAETRPDAFAFEPQSVVRAVAPAGPVQARYRAAMALAAALVVALPLLYVALFGATVAGSVWWATVGADWVDTLLPKNRGTAYVLLRFGPTLIGALVAVALLKPFLSRQRQAAQVRSLSREDEPLLFAHLDHVASLVGVPSPSRVDVDLQVNASAQLARGWRSVARSEYALTIGLPLVGGFDLRQLTCVIAHEFGHFAQRGGMRSTFLVWSVQKWMHRAVYERDAFDRYLELWTRRSPHAAISVLLLAARGGVWGSRQILRGLLNAGTLIVATLSRQMEFDADAQAVRIAGSDAFATTMTRLRVLDIADAHTLGYVNRGLEEGRLGDDWMALMEAHIARISAQEVASALEGKDEPRSMYASHPPMRERIGRARQAKLATGVALDLPARVLFADFTGLVRDCTVDLYRSCLGEQFRASMLVPSAEIFERVGQDETALRRVAEWLPGRLGSALPLTLPANTWADSTALAHGARETSDWGRELAAIESAYEASLSQHGKEDSRVRNQRYAMLLEQGGMKGLRKRFQVPKDAALPTLSERLEQAQTQLDRHQECVDRLARVLAAMARERRASGELLDAECVAQAERASQVFALLNDVAPELLELDRATAVLAAVDAAIVQWPSDDKRMRSAHARSAQDLREVLRCLSAKLSGVPYPFEHHGGEVEMGTVCGLAEFRPDDNAASLLALAGNAGQRLFDLQLLALGHVFRALPAQQDIARAA